MSLETISIKNDFYKDYISPDNDFESILNKRIDHLRGQFHLVDPKWTRDKIIKENFVEIFCWSAFSLELLADITQILQSYGIKSIIDPCCGNAFHTYLFQQFAGFDIFAIDIQKEPNSWTSIYEMNGLDYNELNDKAKKIEKYLYGGRNENEKALFLSWIDRDELALELINRFRGDIIISVGHLPNIMIETCQFLKSNYDLITKYILIMPWGIEEDILIYKKHN